MYQSSLFRLIGLYAISVILLTYYGIEVCPFLETLQVSELITELTGAFVLAGIYRFFFLRQLSKSMTAQEVNLQKPWHFLMVDLSAWFLAGILVTGWNNYHYEFPLESGLKVILGCLTLGIFSASYVALEVENELIRCLADEGRDIVQVRSDKFFSITTKFLIFVILAVLVVAGVLLLLIYKDFVYVIDVLSRDEHFEFFWVAREILFVFALLVVGSFVVARKYSQNLKLIFEYQLKAFVAVEQGNFEAFVPVVSRDEFGLIAQQTNQMIDGLRQKARIEKAFGKYMSPQIAEAVLANEQETHLGGREVNVAILFTDLRDFTPLSERCTPQEVVEILNAYFTLVVGAVHKYHGVLDKFIGDAAMAVYGLDGSDAHEDAVRSGLEILEGLVILNRELEAKGRPVLRNGIGIHCGPVVAGNIGSEERLEYTVIGDAVNTAARLESLTKTLSSTLAISSDVHGFLPANICDQLVYLDDYDLKGKSEKMPVYGLKKRL